jgi:2-hydroxychromene-2-carboxylate isomerase
VHLYVDGADITTPEKVADMAALVGASREEVLAAVNDQAVKDRLKAEVDAALARGVFGSPFIFVDDEPFWGNDRLNQVEAWLETGAF